MLRSINSLFRTRKGQGVHEVTSDTGRFIFIVIVLFVLLGIGLMVTEQGRELGCGLLSRLAAEGLRFIIDTSALGC